MIEVVMIVCCTVGRELMQCRVCSIEVDARRLNILD